MIAVRGSHTDAEALGTYVRTRVIDLRARRRPAPGAAAAPPYANEALALRLSPCPTFAVYVLLHTVRSYRIHCVGACNVDGDSFGRAQWSYDRPQLSVTLRACPGPHRCRQARLLKLQAARWAVTAAPHTHTHTHSHTVRVACVPNVRTYVPHGVPFMSVCSVALHPGLGRGPRSVGAARKRSRPRGWR